MRRKSLPNSLSLSTISRNDKGVVVGFGMKGGFKTVVLIFPYEYREPPRYMDSLAEDIGCMPPREVRVRNRDRVGDG